jgi:hypothetical protein
MGQAGSQPPPPPPSGSAPPPPYGQSSGSEGIQKDLQSLISELSSSSDSSSTDSTSTDDSSSTSTASTTDSSISTLQETFQNLLSSMGVSSSGSDQTSLVSFLKSLSLNLQNTSSVGSIIDIPS